MPDYKNQHFVPRAHLRPFTRNGEGKAINLFNIRLHKSIPNAPVKGQCAKDYLHGAAGDTHLEKLLQDLEGAYAGMVRGLAETTVHPQDEHLARLRFFAGIQHFRTDMAIQRHRQARLGMTDAIGEGALKEAIPEDYKDSLSDRSLVIDSIKMAVESMPNIFDLKMCIVDNATGVDFVTSDDPAVITNRYHVQKLRSTNFGLSHAGTQIFLPLSPRMYFACYDGGAYVMPEKIGNRVKINNPADVHALNALQFIKAGENIYFSNWDTREEIKANFLAAKKLRIDRWSGVRLLVKTSSEQPGFTRWKVATNEEAKDATDVMIHLSSIHPAPTRWLSKMMFRPKVQGFSNGSAAGLVRKAEWLKAREDGLAEPVAFIPRPLNPRRS